MSAIYQEAKGALKEIGTKQQGLENELRKVPGYVVFPSVGRAGAIVGGAYGHGVAFEHNEPIGEASLGQFTLGVQLGGQTFHLLVLFRSQEALERFKRGRIAFNANASADIVKAAASGTADYEKDVYVKAYSMGGMLLEVSLGIQTLSFKAKSVLEEHPQSEKR
jgi:lipid-binding SYLF domain-containing protein